MDVKYVQIIILACVFAVQFLFEHLFPQKKEINDFRNERFNILIGLGNLLIILIPASFFVEWLEMIRQHKFGVFLNINFPYLAALVLIIILLDFWMYVWHRLNHLLPFLWKFHKFHHADTKMNSTTALRFHIAELVLSYPGKALMCFVFGIGYIPLLIYEVLFFISIVIHHSNIYITQKTDDTYRILFASPRMHRIHHSTIISETNSNFGGLFSFWDRLFGTWIRKPREEVKFGLPGKQ